MLTSGERKTQRYSTTGIPMTKGVTRPDPAWRANPAMQAQRCAGPAMLVRHAWVHNTLLCMLLRCVTAMREAIWPSTRIRLGSNDHKLGLVTSSPPCCTSSRWPSTPLPAHAVGRSTVGMSGAGLIARSANRSARQTRFPPSIAQCPGSVINGHNSVLARGGNSASGSDQTPGCNNDTRRFVRVGDPRRCRTNETTSGFYPGGNARLLARS
jgi:hypothetical protein